MQFDPRSTHSRSESYATSFKAHGTFSQGRLCQCVIVGPSVKNGPIDPCLSCHSSMHVPIIRRARWSPTTLAFLRPVLRSGARLQIHYNGWPPRWDEWLSWDSPRIAPFRTRTQHLPHSQHVSPAPISAVRNAPITGTDDVRVVMPEVSRVLQEISPMVDEVRRRFFVPSLCLTC